MSRRIHPALLLGTLAAATAPVMPEPLPSRGPWDSRAPHRGPYSGPALPKNRAQETERRLRQIKHGVILTTAGQERAKRCARDLRAYWMSRR